MEVLPGVNHMYSIIFRVVNLQLMGHFLQLMGHFMYMLFYTQTTLYKFITMN